MTNDRSDPTEPVTAMFGLLTARLEDAAGLAADGQNPGGDHRLIASQIASHVAEAGILTDAIEALLGLKGAQTDGPASAVE